MITSGWKIIQNFDRPDPTLIESFRGIPVSNINDMQNRMFCMRGLVPFNGKPLIGSAFTVRLAEGDNLLLHCALDMIRPGDVLVIDAGGYPNRAILGEVMTTYAASRGCAGIVLDGAIRDRDGLANASIPVYAKGVNPNGPYKNGPGEINTTIACGGQVVSPGDIILGDPDGVVVIQAGEAKELAAVARDKMLHEEVEMKQIREGKYDYTPHETLYLKTVLRSDICTE